jgi:putative modified peptide
MAKNFTREFADKLLDKLSSDDAFRAHFKKDPRAALKELGYETPAEDLGVEGSDPVMCCDGNLALASKQDIAAARQKLQTQLSGSMFHYIVTI